MADNRKSLYVGTEDFQKGFKKGEYKIPTEMDPNRMDKDYYLAWARYVWSQYVSDRTLLPFGGYLPSGRSMEEVRAYALGKQDKSIYMDILDDCDPNKNEGYLNINWDNVQILTKFRDLVRGKMITMDFDVVTTAIDETSTKERMEQMNMMKLLTNPAIMEVFAATGVMPSNVKLPPGLETPEDIEMYNKMGGLRLSQELMIQDAIEVTNYESRWDTLRGQLAENIIDFNIYSTITYVEKTTGIVKKDIIDPKELVCRPSKYQDHRDIDFAGRVKSKTIQEIRLESDLTEEALYKIARLYKGRFGNSAEIGDFSEYDYQNTSRNKLGGVVGGGDTLRLYDNFSVHVLEFYFIGKEAEKYIMGFHNDGNFIYDQVDLQAELDKKASKKGKEMDVKTIEYVYRCQWIVGTEYVFDCEKETEVVRQGYDGCRRAILPITIYSDRTPSLMERCIPYVDDIQLAVLKKRNVLAKMPPGPRWAVDKSLMEDSIMIGQTQYTILDMIELFPKTGIFVYESRGEWEDSEMSGSNRPPIMPMPAGVAEDIQILMNDFAFNVELLRQVTGISEVTDGTSDQRDMLVKVMEGLQAAANNSLRPHFQVYYGGYQNDCQYTAYKWKSALVSGDIKSAYIPIGDNIIKPVLLTKDLYNYDMGIKVLLKPTQEDKQLLLQQLFQDKENNKISPGDYYVAYNMIQAGDLKKAQLFLAKASERWMMRLQQMEIEKMNAQAQGNAQAAVVSEQARMQTEQVKIQGEKEKLILEYELRKQENAQLHGYKMEEITREVQSKTDGDMAKAVVENGLQGNPV